MMDLPPPRRSSFLASPRKTSSTSGRSSSISSSTTVSASATASERKMQTQSRSSTAAHNNKSSNRSANTTTAAATAASISSATQAASSLALLLQEDPLLTQYELHSSTNNEQAAFRYAASLLQSTDAGSGTGTGTNHTNADVQDGKNMNSSGGDSGDTYGKARPKQQKQQQQKIAMEAYEEVERKVTLVESLAERISRTSPEAVAGSLLSLHGYTVQSMDTQDGAVNKDDVSDSAATVADPPKMGATLAATRERCERLQRQGVVLESVASRVETSLQRGLTKMETATTRLERVLQLSATLKMILRLQFEASKLQDLDLEDPRDLTRAAASVAIMEGLLAKPELSSSTNDNKMDVVEAVRPQAIQTGKAVRKAAADLLAKHHSHGVNTTKSVVQLGTTLQVYFHLGELPQAAWSSVSHAFKAAEKATSTLWSPTTLVNLREQAKRLGTSNKPKEDPSQVQLKAFREEAAETWARAVTQASLQVWNLHQVLHRKSDPVTRQPFRRVLAEAPIPELYKDFAVPLASPDDFSVFKIYWERLCYKMGDRLQHVLEYENGKFFSDVAALYPSVQLASLQMLASLTDTMQIGSQANLNTNKSNSGTPNSSNTIEDSMALSSSFDGILGGSAALGDSFLQWTTSTRTSAPTAGLTSTDTWTVTKDATNENSKYGGTYSSTSMATITKSSYWTSLQGNHASGKGLFRLQQSFLEDSLARLVAPLDFMFQENLTLDETGNAVSHLPLLPSKFDIQRLDRIVRQELALVDPREGSGGDVSTISMICRNVQSMIAQFCEQAQNAVSHVSHELYLDANGQPTEALLHDLKVTKIMNAMVQSLTTVSKKVFLDPYRPSVTRALEEAASTCDQALKPARQELDQFVQSQILNPLCIALNNKIAEAIGRVHYVSYTQDLTKDSDSDVSFVQKSLADMYERISSQHLAQLPKKYAAFVASSVGTFSIYTFVSNITLMRPLEESTRLHLTQDLADLELLLEQLMVKGGHSAQQLADISNGKPYAELRAVRLMLFWTGLDDTTKPATKVAKSLLRESWVRDVRPSTLFHFLFSFGPSLLSSPHHFKKMRADAYVKTLISMDGKVDDGEANAWMTTMACCDSYQQRESALTSTQETSKGDVRIANIVTALGPELMRRQP